MTRALTGSAVLGVWLVACSGGDTEPEPQAARDAGAERGEASGLPDFSQIRCEPTLPSLQRDVFGVACAFDSCHGDNNPAWDLYLMAPHVESLLVDARAYTCQGRTLVVPGSAEQSFLWQKLSEPRPACGAPMPLGMGPLPASVLECIRGWITSLDAADASRR